MMNAVERNGSLLGYRGCHDECSVKEWVTPVTEDVMMNAVEWNGSLLGYRGCHDECSGTEWVMPGLPRMS